MYLKKQENNNPNNKKLSLYKLTGKGYEKGWFTNSKARYRIFAGARNTKKSVVIMGYEIIMKILSNPLRNILVTRQNDVDNYQSTFANIVNLIIGMDLEKYFIFKKSPLSIIYKPTRQKIFFRGMNNPTSVTSVKAEVGFITDVYIEEAFEIRSYEDFRKIDGSIRGKLPEGLSLQITLCMNTWSKEHWIYGTFFKDRLEDNVYELENNNFMDYTEKDFTLGFGFGLYLHKSTFRINEFRTNEYDLAMNMLKDKAPLIYQVEGLGMWGQTTEGTYPEYSDKLYRKMFELNKMQFYSTTIGIDTGLSSGEGKLIKENDRKRSATTMSLVGLTSDYSKLVAIDSYYHSNETAKIKKTEPELIEEMVDTIIEWIEKKYENHYSILKGRVAIYVDSADIGFRQSLQLQAKKRGYGLDRIVFIASTKNKIQTRVDFERLLMAWEDLLIIFENNKQLDREFRANRKGEKGQAREDFDDHMINAFEYAWIPLMPKIRRRQDFKEH